MVVVEREYKAKNQELESEVERLKFQVASLSISQRTQERHVTLPAGLPRAIEDIPADILLAYARSRMEAQTAGGVPISHRYEDKSR
ncbi:unnamed protein product [Heligmosomoides polygyrus]|uniref:PKcGMP_CC domain-containing protein n=1 Tax=Heligmosomoides polygyrus TaxID=6339 RepID=A0A183F9F5_HELPZ|nr:unnamed protein product [Heligmosomoides polygyrus]